MKVKVIGKGWIGSIIANHFDAEFIESNALDLWGLLHEIGQNPPDVIINCAGKCGSPNIDWCSKTKENRELTTYVNTYAPFNIYEACRRFGVKFVHLSSGCLWSSGRGVTEEHDPDLPSFYSETKYNGDLRLQDTDAIMIRLRMPIDGTPDSRNLITKLTKYPRVISYPNSITYIPDMIDAINHLINNDHSGVFNVANEGFVTGEDIIESYKKHVDPDHSVEYVSMLDLAKNRLVTDGRSNCILSGEKLEGTGFTMPSAEDRLDLAMREYGKALKG